MELASFSRFSGPCSLALLLFSVLPLSLSASESAVDCETASETLSAGLASHPGETLELFVDAMRTNPGCRRSLLITALETHPSDPEMIRRILFIARQEFPGEDTLFAEAALVTIPDQMEVIRSAFEANVIEMQATLSSDPVEKAPSLVELPPEAQALDEDLREAIARMAAKVEGKYWPEQDLEEDPISYRNRDDVRVSRESLGADEASLENAIPIDQHDERTISTSQLRINDHWSRDDRIRLDESKFVSEDRGNSREMQEARKREIAPAGAVGFPKHPVLRRPSYYIPPAEGDYRSTIDFDDEERPRLIIRPPSAFRTIPDRSDRAGRVGKQ